GNAQKILRLRRLVLASSSEKPIYLWLSTRRWNALSSTRWQTDAASPPNFPKAAGFPRGVHPPPARIALNVPCFEGLSPTSGENSTSPVIRSAVSNFPLNTNVPASRPTLPSINSTGPEKVTELPSPRLHFASEGVAGPHAFNLGSTTRKLPFPSPCASNRRERGCSFANVISTFHLPIRSGDCA